MYSRNSEVCLRKVRWKTSVDLSEIGHAVAVQDAPGYPDRSLRGNNPESTGRAARDRSTRGDHQLPFSVRVQWQFVIIRLGLDAHGGDRTVDGIRIDGRIVDLKAGEFHPRQG